MKNTVKLSPMDSLKKYWKDDLLSGLLVSLIALPLSLGIAKASGFPPIMGVWTAMIGGLVASFFGSAPLTIKGPAAGLIVICAGAVADFGKFAPAGSTPDQIATFGWQLALACVVAAGIAQMLMGVLKLGSLSDFFPSSAIHGMLAAIGIIILVKQAPIILGVDPALYKGMDPIELIKSIPNFFRHMNKDVAIIGGISLVIMFGMPRIKNKIVKAIPPAIVVLVVSIIVGVSLKLSAMPADMKSLLHVDNLVENLSWNVNFSHIGSGVFVKYFIMFLLIGSIESLLTAKAVNGLDPFKRKTNYNADLIATGAGNTIAGIFGGLPMISEIARSSANINNGGKTMWANFFHGMFLLLFVLLALPLLNMIPNAALAAILISVGYKLASPKEFIHTYHIGKEQLIIFLGTIVMTLVEDLLVGVATGILLKFIIHLINGVPFKSIYSASLKIEKVSENKFIVQIKSAAIFSNFLKIKKELSKLPKGKEIVLDLGESSFIDHSVMDGLESFGHGYVNEGGSFSIEGLNDHKSFTSHAKSARKLKKA